MPLPAGRERPCEVVTPPLVDGHEQALERLLAPARELGFTVPQEAAVHLHVDGAPFRRPEAFANLVRLFGHWREVLWAVLETNPACRRLAPLPPELVTLVEHGWQDADGRSGWSRLQEAARPVGVTKYADVNLVQLLSERPVRDTVEVRILPGSIDGADIVRRAALVELLLARCLDSRPLPRPERVRGAGPARGARRPGRGAPVSAVVAAAGPPSGAIPAVRPARAVAEPDAQDEAVVDTPAAGARIDDVVRAHLPGLVRYATVLTGDGHTAADLVQEVLLRAHVRWARIGLMERPDLYLRRMVTNEHLSWRRRWHVRNLRPEADESLAGHMEPQLDHAEHVVEDDAMWRQLATLPPRQRAVLVLRFYEGLSDPEIASVLGTSPATVRSHASRALAALRHPTPSTSVEK